jgi:RTX calcium-binding nonapeptide repeat (4 copies)
MSLMPATLPPQRASGHLWRVGSPTCTLARREARTPGICGRRCRQTAGDAGFNSNFDWNTASVGDQTLAAGSGSVVNVVAAGGDDTITLGSTGAPVTSGQARINVNAGDGSDTLVWEDATDATGRTINFQGDVFNQVFVPFVGFATGWNGGPPEQIAVHAGTGADTINLAGSTAATTSTIDAGGGADAVNVGNGADGMDDLLGPVTIQGAAGTDSLDIDESSATTGHSFALDAATLQRNGAALLGFGGFEALSLAFGSGNDTLTATSAAQGFTATGGAGADNLTGGGGADVIDAGDGDDRLSSRDSQLDVDRCGTGADTVIADMLDGVASDCERQDRGFPAAAAPAPVTNVTVAAAPSLTSLELAPKRFSAARSGATITATARRGSAVSYRLSGFATVRFAVEQLTKGRISKGRCARPTGSNRRGKSCTMTKALKTRFTYGGVSGRNGFRFTGRLGSRPLNAGDYNLVATPLAADGKTGTPQRARFTIVR